MEKSRKLKRLTCELQVEHVIADMDMTEVVGDTRPLVVSLYPDGYSDLRLTKEPGNDVLEAQLEEAEKGRYRVGATRTLAALVRNAELTEEESKKCRAAVIICNYARCNEELHSVIRCHTTAESDAFGHDYHLLPVRLMILCSHATEEKKKTMNAIREEIKWSRCRSKAILEALDILAGTE